MIQLKCQTNILLYFIVIEWFTLSEKNVRKTQIVEYINTKI